MRDLSQTWNELSTQYDRKQSDLVKEVIAIVGECNTDKGRYQGYWMKEPDMEIK